MAGRPVIGGDHPYESGYRLRSISVDEGDGAFLREMLYEAAAWRRESPRPAPEGILSSPAIARYVEGWGRPGDEGVIAQTEGGKPIGAAWYRLFTDDEHGYGFISSSVPEITVAVSPSVQRRGVGTSLLTELIEQARKAAYPALSLSVEEDNPAIRLYERLGFTRVGRVGNAWTMRLDLS